MEGAISVAIYVQMEDVTSKQLCPLSAVHKKSSMGSKSCTFTRISYFSEKNSKSGDIKSSWTYDFIVTASFWRSCLIIKCTWCTASVFLTTSDRQLATRFSHRKLLRETSGAAYSYKNTGQLSRFQLEKSWGQSFLRLLKCWADKQ